jgi:UPF0755 protein
MARRKKGRFALSLVLLCIAGGGAFYVYQKFFTGVQLKDKTYTYFFIERTSDFSDVVNDLHNQGIIETEESFEWLAKKMGLDRNLHPGKYRITNGMTVRQVINLLKYNKQEKVKLTYNSQINNLDEFIEYTDEKLELNSDEIESFLLNDIKLKEYFKLDPDNAFALVVPGVYEVSWSITTNELMGLIRDRYHRIWTDVRANQARQIGFSIPEIITIASIVQCESSIRSEQEKIAGVYINRLRQGMPLQADPTLKFANRNYRAQRVLDEDKQINSPYNTYRYKGLPPGPICLVNQQAIDATLNYKRHNFIYFCARPDLNGYSDFSASYEQHRKHAAAYQRALDKMGISR